MKRLHFKVSVYILITLISLLITACTKSVIEEPTIIHSQNVLEGLVMRGIDNEHIRSKSLYGFNYDNLPKGTLIVNLSVYQKGVLMEEITKEEVLSDLFNAGNIGVLIAKVTNNENKLYMQIGLNLNNNSVYKSFELFNDYSLKSRNEEFKDIYKVEIGEEYNILCIYEDENRLYEIETELDQVIEKNTYVYLLTVKHQ